MVRPHASLPFHPLAPSGCDEPRFTVSIGFQTDRHRSNLSIAWKDSLCCQDSSVANKSG
jgi:hypothetical protein